MRPFIVIFKHCEFSNDHQVAILLLIGGVVLLIYKHAKEPLDCDQYQDLRSQRFRTLIFRCVGTSTCFKIPHQISNRNVKTQIRKMRRGQDFSVSCRYHLLSLIASRRAMLRCNFSTSLTITLKTRCLKFTFKVSFFRQSERSELSLFSKKLTNLIITSETKYLNLNCEVHFFPIRAKSFQVRHFW